MKRPCTNRAAISSQMPRVAAQSRLAALTTAAPPRRMGRIGYRSESTPNGRFARAIPRITAEMVREAVLALMPNSTRRTGSTGWVM